MNIAVVGYGKMGKMIEQAAVAQGHTIAAIIDPVATGASLLTGVKISKSFSASEKLGTADAAIEFTQPGAAVANIIALAEIKFPL